VRPLRRSRGAPRGQRGGLPAASAPGPHRAKLISACKGGSRSTAPPSRAREKRERPRPSGGARGLNSSPSALGSEAAAHATPGRTRPPKREWSRWAPPCLATSTGGLTWGRGPSTFPFASRRRWVTRRHTASVHGTLRGSGIPPGVGAGLWRPRGGTAITGEREFRNMSGVVRSDGS